jgi:6,7-dimethyl-8-ribityllumazine synthase
MKKILIVQAVFYEDISKMLLEGAVNKIIKNNFDYEVVSLKGALEIPCAISIAKETKQYAGFVALGCVIRGETTHYETVCNESASGLNDLAINYQLAIGNGILTVENEEQALERADLKKLDKGGFAVEACLSIILLKEKFTKL